MSEMQTTPVFKCRGCGKPLVATHLSTTVPDPEGRVLNQLMRGLGDMALCKPCKARYNWLAAQGRSDEFHAAPSILIASRGQR